ncbi:sec1 family domain-containing protein 1 [Mytilus galloprovincialis]|uniref:Sec1 family domain-containing protein 1 n=1 Tax=Mytilus galloprovincialis TaxID=29158 RepID=A0A8B6CFI8_MYTGA|nr:sec1 family domain-containing protein 1 [Mytilus galloprovincialis]
MKSAMGLEGDDEVAFSMMNDTTAKLTSTVSSLPELLEMKRLIDMHTNIATAMLEHIKHRKLDVYFEMEEKMMSKALLDKSLMDIISDPDLGTPEDKVRIFIIALICGPPMSDAEIDQYCVALTGANCEVAPITFIRRWRAYNKMNATPSQYGGGGTTTVGMFNKLMNKSSQFLMEGVKNLVIKRHNLPATRIVDGLMESKTLQEIEDYRYFDPKLLRSDSSSVPRNKSPFQEAYVFMIGGGNYIEYQNLIDYAKSKSSSSAGQKKIVYGCSQLVNAARFLEQLGHLGQEMNDPDDPFSVGRGDLDPFGRTGGGMVFDPFHPGGRRGGPDPSAGLPGRLPRGAVPPGARFDPFGPPGTGPGPDPDHLPPPGYDDMFM